MHFRAYGAAKLKSTLTAFGSRRKCYKGSNDRGVNANMSKLAISGCTLNHNTLSAMHRLGWVAAARFSFAF